MAGFDDVFAGLRSAGYIPAQATNAVEECVRTGNIACLAGIKPGETAWVWRPVAKAVARPDRMTDPDRFALRGMIADGCWEIIAGRIAGWVEREKPDEDLFAAAYREMCSQGASHADILKMLAEHLHGFSRDGKPSSSGRFLLSLPDCDLKEVLCGVTGFLRSDEAISLLLEHAPKRLAPLAPEMMKHLPPLVRNRVCGTLLKKGGAPYESLVAGIFRSINHPRVRFEVGLHLSEFNPEKYAPEMLQTSRAVLAKDDGYEAAAAEYMIKRLGKEAIPEIISYISNSRDGYAMREILSDCLDLLGRDAIPVMCAAIEAADGSKSGNGQLRLQAVEGLVSLDDGSHAPTIAGAIEQGFCTYRDESDALIRYILLAGRWDAGALEDSLWSFARHKSKPVREAAARALAKLGDKALPKAGQLLADRKADMRMIGAVLVGAVGTPAAERLLEKHLETEEDDAIRDAILGSLQSAWKASGRRITREEVEARAASRAAKLKWPPAAWVESVPFPALAYSDGSPLSADTVRYLVSRQSAFAEIRPPIELAPLYEMIGRASSADFALQILHAFLASGADAKDKWALVLAAMLGDDRIVPVLAAQITQWVDGGRGKLAECAVQALSLLATDRALMAIDSIAMRYRTKMKNVGNAAVEAFAAAADALGVTPEELGDRVVPWLGFEPGKPRVIDCGGKAIEVRISPDHKLVFFDPEKNKRMGSLPSSASAEVKSEFKELSALLKEVAKTQTLRLENLMVRQYRWPAPRWKELFIGHPLMAPFGMRLVWGARDAEGKPMVTFRALEDGSLTGVRDEPIELDPAWNVAMVHPLELGDKGTGLWSEHLADYEIKSPFPQMERPVVRCAPEDQQVKFYKELSGTKINGMTFKGRAERLGWRRGSVCDGGWITTYHKSFPSAGVDAFVILEDMCVGIDMYTEISIGDAFFTGTGTVQIGSYVYDEPSSDGDPRLVPFGQVPTIVFSEVMGDLKKIAGDKQRDGEE